MSDPIFICGSTASGKSSLAIGLAKAIDAEIINGDAYQVYRGIETLSAAPSASELSSVPHHLFGVLDPSEPMDAQRYREMALASIEAVTSKGKKAIVVGGSGMYLKFLTHGPSPVPAGDAKLREQLEQQSDDELVQQLTQLDPRGAAITNLQNRRYVIRALEICLLSGEKMSDIKSDWATQSDIIEKSLKGVVLQWQPETLRQRIAQRTQQMLEQGAIEEVSALNNPSITCEKAIGIEPIRQFLAAKISRERCQELIYFATCQYAKRQRTWFKKEKWLSVIEMDPHISEDHVVEQALQHTSEHRPKL